MTREPAKGYRAKITESLSIFFVVVDQGVDHPGCQLAAGRGHLF